VSNTRDPTDQKEDEDDEASPHDEDRSERPKAWVLGLVGASGLIASAASVFTDISLSDVIAVTGGLATAGVLSTAAAAVTVLVRRRSFAAQVEALEEVRQDIDDLVETDEVRQDFDDRVRTEVRIELLKLRESNDARLEELERRMGRTGWFQGAVYAALGAAVAVLLIVFNHWVPVIRLVTTKIWATARITSASNHRPGTADLVTGLNLAFRSDSAR